MDIVSSLAAVFNINPSILQMDVKSPHVESLHINMFVLFPRRGEKIIQEPHTDVYIFFPRRRLIFKQTMRHACFYIFDCIKKQKL